MFEIRKKEDIAYEYYEDENTDGKDTQANKRYIGFQELTSWINCELAFQEFQTGQFQKGYFHALKKLNKLLHEKSSVKEKE